MGEVGGAVRRGAPAIGARAPPRMDALFGMALALVRKLCEQPQHRRHGVNKAGGGA